MGTEGVTGHWQYRDAEISVLLPSYLRPKKGIRFFSSRRDKKNALPAVLSLAIEIQNEDMTRAVWSTIVNAKESEWLGVRQRIVRRGKAPYLADGLELLGSSHVGPTGQFVHDYHVLFLAGDARIYCAFGGQGELESFDHLCRNIVSSLRFRGEGGGVEERAGATPPATPLESG